MRIASLRPFKFLPVLGLLVACGSPEPQVAPSVSRSTDPVLNSVISSFRHACIGNAPDFSSARMKAAFASNRPMLAPGMSFLATGKPGQSCKVTVLNYGTGRAKPTVGDINALGRALQARIGGSFKPKKANSAGGAQVRVNRRSYDVFGYVGKKGHLTFNVFE